MNLNDFELKCYMYINKKIIIRYKILWKCVIMNDEIVDKKN